MYYWLVYLWSTPENMLQPPYFTKQSLHTKKSDNSMNIKDIYLWNVLLTSFTLCSTLWKFHLNFTRRNLWKTNFYQRFKSFLHSKHMYKEILSLLFAKRTNPFQFLLVTFLICWPALVRITSLPVLLGI